MKPLVFLEERDGAITRDSLGVLSHVSAQRPDVAAVVIPPTWHGDATAIAACGAGRLYIASGAMLSEQPIAPRAKVLATLLAGQSFDTLIFAGSVLATDLAARIAGQLDAGLIWNATRLDLGADIPTATRSAMADTIVATTEWRTAKRVVLVRQRAFEPVEQEGRGALDIVTLDLPEADGVRLVRVDPRAEATQLAHAKVVVSAGRGIGRAENFALIEDLATALDGTVGVSLPLVEAGWAPRAMQVGQTGAIVQPALYIACGISGQFQHWLGIERSGTIVAINTDASAPIMSACDIAVVGDLKAIVPRLAELVRSRAAG